MKLINSVLFIWVSNWMGTLYFPSCQFIIVIGLKIELAPLRTPHCQQYLIIENIVLALSERVNQHVFSTSGQCQMTNSCSGGRLVVSHTFLGILHTSAGRGMTSFWLVHQQRRADIKEFFDPMTKWWACQQITDSHVIVPGFCQGVYVCVCWGVSEFVVHSARVSPEFVGTGQREREELGESSTIWTLLMDEAVSQSAGDSSASSQMAWSWRDGIGWVESPIMQSALEAILVYILVWIHTTKTCRHTTNYEMKNR